MSDLDKIEIERIAFGIRFKNQFGLEDALGAVIDDILALPNYGPERFATTASTSTQKQLVSTNNDEAITVSGGDAVFDTKAARRSVVELPRMAEDFVTNVWTTVLSHTAKTPNINRYGTLIKFALPEHWNPIVAMLHSEAAETSEFDLRYTRRLAAEQALAMRDINDFRLAIYHIQTRDLRTTALLDFQHHFTPEIAADKAHKEHPYVRFVERAVAYFRTTAWEFISAHIEQHVRRAA